MCCHIVWLYCVVFLWCGGGWIVTQSVVVLLLSFCGVVDVLSHSVLLCFCGVVVNVLSHTAWLYGCCVSGVLWWMCCHTAWLYCCCVSVGWWWMCCHMECGYTVEFLWCGSGCVVTQCGCTVVVFLWGGGGCVVT